MFRRLFRSAARQLHVLSTQTIKPASPTPSRLSRYNLSSMDQFSPHAYIPMSEDEALGLVFPAGLIWGLFSPSALVHPVNMRLKILPPVPETSIGNIYWSIFIPTRNESEINLNALVEKIQKGKMEIGAVKTLDATKYWSNLLEFSRNNYSFFFCSSLCRMPFYQIDFGWGCPSKVILVDAPINNSFILMDTPNGDGIEAMVSLDEENMATFEQDKEILAFTSLHSTAGPL
ncbi:hypothetical protein LguiB_005515 [Lonicera macranthoides]